MVVTTSLTNASLKDSEKTQAVIVKQITDLQNNEKTLYTKLEKLSAQGAPVSEQTKIVDKINELSSDCKNMHDMGMDVAEIDSCKEAMNMVKVY